MPNTYDLTTEQGVVSYMRAATSENDWNVRCNAVKQANDGNYPEFWYVAIVQSGVFHQKASEFGRSDGGLTVRSFNL